MIISSELTGKTYKTVEECLKAEKEYKLLKEEEEKKKADIEKRKDFLYNRIIADCDEFMELCGLKLETNGHGYRLSVHNGDKADEIFTDILNAWLS